MGAHDGLLVILGRLRLLAGLHPHQGPFEVGHRIGVPGGGGGGPDRRLELRDFRVPVAFQKGIVAPRLRLVDEPAHRFEAWVAVVESRDGDDFSPAGHRFFGRELRRRVFGGARDLASVLWAGFALLAAFVVVGIGVGGFLGRGEVRERGGTAFAFGECFLCFG